MNPRRKPRKSRRDSEPDLSFPIRLNRFIARSGVCSRRQADELIKDGRVQVNGSVVTQLGTQVQKSDEIVVGGSRLYIEEPMYLLLNKPKDTITTASDEKGRRTVMDLVVDDRLEGKGLFPVGRLDRDTTGALLLTNDGELGHRLMHPKWQVSKIYVVKTTRPVADKELSRLLDGVELEDGPAKANAAGYVADFDKTTIAVEVHEGRNHLVRRMVEAIGHETVSLDRTRFAGLDLHGLRRGKWRRLTQAETRALRRLVRL